MKDSSQRVPSGVNGTVIDVQVFTRDGMQKDDRAKDIERGKLAEIDKNLRDEYRILEEATKERLRSVFVGAKGVSVPGKPKGFYRLFYVFILLYN